MTRPLHHLGVRHAAFALTVVAAACTGAWAQPHPGITIQGNTGGLVLPTADVLSVGTMALSYGNYQDPVLGKLRQYHQNASLGFGLLPGLEFFGRFAEYTTDRPGSIIVNGTRDISANFKYQLPTFFAWQPKLAVGVNDLSGGAVWFKSGYAVASQTWGNFGLSLGYASGQNVLGNPRALKSFDGAFVGGNYRFADNWSLLTEFQQDQRHLGVRWTSDAIPALAHARLIAQVQRDTNQFNLPGAEAASTSYNLSLVVPFGANEARDQIYQPAAALPPIEVSTADTTLTPNPFKATAQDQLDAIRRALIDLGLERVRVGTSMDALVVEFENHRYAHNDVDAIGLVLGVAAEQAPKDLQRVKAIRVENGIQLDETSVPIDAWRTFLRSGDSAELSSSMHWTSGVSDPIEVVTWLDTQPGPATRLRVTLRPELRTTLGTEVGALDYSLYANVQAVLPLWRGGQLLANSYVPLGNTPNMDKGGVFDLMRAPSGIKTLALQQTFHLIGDRWLNRVSAGRFQHNANGVEVDSVLLAPWGDGEFLGRAAAYNRIPGNLFYADRAGSLSYRHALAPATFFEVGAHQFTDGSRGPSFEWTRWFGDVGVQLFFRKGGSVRMAGLELTVPLTPRQGMKPGIFSVAGTGHHPQTVRTRLTDASSPLNFVTPGGVVPLRFELALDETHRNAGRMSHEYIHSQKYRMREAFYRYSTTTPAGSIKSK